MNIYDQALSKIQQKENDRSKQPNDSGELSVADMEKIASHAKRFGHEVKEVVDAVLSNFIAYRAIVGKNPSRMDYYEDTLKEYLESLVMVKSVLKLPKGGKNSLHLREGQIVPNSEKLPHLKSLDLKIDFLNGETVYVIHKYTQESGGAQDGAMRDALLTLAHSLDKKGERVVNVMAILDGNYYQETNRTGISRIQDAQSRYPNALMGTYEQFQDLTRTIWS